LADQKSLQVTKTSSQRLLIEGEVVLQANEKQLLRQENTMKANPLKSKPALLAAIGLVALGMLAYAATTVIVAVGVIPHSEFLNGPATVTFRTISFAPGEVGAWHYHPGPLFNVVTQGTVTVEDGCGEEQAFTVGQAFEEGGRVHRPKNLGTVATFAYQVFIVPEGSPTTVNIPNNERRCGPPRGVDDCKGNWINFTHPRTFSNQGDCIQYVNTGK
jgi:quercetin dioxygenase-like cupin family protein